MHCPYTGCVGQLIKIQDTKTQVQYPTLDRNTHRERFRCTDCKKTVYRAWQWETDDETLRDYPLKKR